MIFPVPSHVAHAHGIVLPNTQTECVVITEDCPVCLTPTIMVLPFHAVELYRAGALVQEAFPTLPVEDREMIITGAHSACWDTLIGPAE